MTAKAQIRSWVKASDAERRTGLLGYLSVSYSDLILDGLVLRQTADGRLALSFPARTDRSGRRHPYIRPVDSDARRIIETDVLRELGQRGDLS